jgi:hypothetical protein
MITRSFVVETDEMRPLKAWCMHGMVHATLPGGRPIATPLWPYPFLTGLSETELDDIEPMYDGVRWRAVDERILMFLGNKAPGAQPPSIAAE